MVSDDTAGSSGATGIACDADIAIRLKPMANAEAVSNFMDFSFPVVSSISNHRFEFIKTVDDAGPPHQ